MKQILKSVNMNLYWDQYQIALEGIREDHYGHIDLWYIRIAHEYLGPINNQPGSITFPTGYSVDYTKI